MAFVSILASTALLLSGTADASRRHHKEHKTDKCTDIDTLLRSKADASKAVDLVHAAGLVLESDGTKRTLFLPTNSAIDAVPKDVLASLTADTDVLTLAISGHVATGGALKASDLSDGMALATAAGFDVTVEVGEDISITAPNGGSTATVVAADLEACDWVVHFVDAVLLPGDETEEPEELAPAMAPEMAEKPHHHRRRRHHPKSDDAAAAAAPEAVETVAEVATGVYGVYGDEDAGRYGAYGALEADAEAETAERVAGGDADDASAVSDAADAVAEGTAAGSAAAGADDSVIVEGDGSADTASAGVVIAGAVVAGVAAVIAGTAGVVYARKRAANASIAGSSALSAQTV